MYFCPSCKIQLVREQDASGIYWVCQSCSHWLIGNAVLRQKTEPSFVGAVWLQAKSLETSEGWPCPACSKPMKKIRRENPGPPLYFEVCLDCETSWLGPLERSALPPLLPPLDDPHDLSHLPPEAAKTIAMIEVEKMALEARKQDSGLEELALWQKLLMFLGLPMKSEDHEPWVRFPWATVGVALLVVFTSLYCFPRIDQASEIWGFTPSHWGRFFGLTPFTSFFIHGNWLHLLGNMYFFLLFGLSVEKRAGPAHFLVLIFLSSLVGDALTWAWDPTDNRPSIGASGGIAGVMVFYALAYPWSNIYLYFWWDIISIPSFLFMFLWVFFQAAYGMIQVKGWDDGIGYFAHVGGALFGLIYWIFIRKSLNPGLKSDEEMEGL